jgi:secondary thiamine-phosphate synthase enzyme
MRRRLFAVVLSTHTKKKVSNKEIQTATQGGEKMEALKARESAASALDCYSNEGTVKVFSKTIIVKTNERTDLVNLSDDVRDFVQSTGVKDGYVQVSSLHTTAGLIVNEWQNALLADIKSTIENMVPRDTYYKHNDPQFSDCDRHNADSHLRIVVLGHSLSVPINQGELVLGQWQSVILTEFDGPNQRKVFLQVFGI